MYFYEVVPFCNKYGFRSFNSHRNKRNRQYLVDHKDEHDGYKPRIRHYTRAIPDSWYDCGYSQIMSRNWKKCTKHKRQYMKNI